VIHLPLRLALRSEFGVPDDVDVLDARDDGV